MMARWDVTRGPVEGAWDMAEGEVATHEQSMVVRYITFRSSLVVATYGIRSCSMFASRELVPVVAYPDMYDVSKYV